MRGAFGHPYGKNMWIYVVLFPSISIYAEFMLPGGQSVYWSYALYILLSLPQLLLFRRPSPFWPTTLKLFLVAETSMALFYGLAYSDVFDFIPGFLPEEIVHGIILGGGFEFMKLMLCYGLMRLVFPWLKQALVAKSGRAA